MKISMSQTAALVLCSSFVSSLSAETRQHGAHEHGVAQLLVAVDGQQVQLMLESPMFNLAGFGRAESEQQHQELEEIKEMLNEPLALFNVDGGECTVASVTMSGEAFEGEHEAHDEHAKKDEHDEHEEHAKKDEHDEHEEHAKKDEHDEHDEHAKKEEHSEHDHEESNHADVSVEWVLECTDLDDRLNLRVSLFDYFEHFEQLDVQYLAGVKQGAETLTAKQPVLQF